MKSISLLDALSSTLKRYLEIFVINGIMQFSSEAVNNETLFNTAHHITAQHNTVLL
jgi:hypothetical protein